MTNAIELPPDTKQTVLVLQGGGALGAYQAGVYQALHEAGIEPDWVIGTSIGAINASLIAFVIVCILCLPRRRQPHQPRQRRRALPRQCLGPLSLGHVSARSSRRRSAARCR